MKPTPSKRSSRDSGLKIGEDRDDVLEKLLHGSLIRRRPLVDSGHAEPHETAPQRHVAEQLGHGHDLVERLVGRRGGGQRILAADELDEGNLDDLATGIRDGVGDDHEGAGREVAQVLRAHRAGEFEVDPLEHVRRQALAGCDGHGVVLGVRGVATGEDDDLGPLTGQRLGRPAGEYLATHYQGPRCSEP